MDFFRSKTITNAFDYIYKMFTNHKFTTQFLDNRRYNYEILFLIILFIWVEWNNRTKQEPISGRFSMLRLALCFGAILAIGTYSDYKEFIYFQF